MAERVFSPNDAEPAPMTVIFVGRDICFLQRILISKTKDAKIINHSRPPFEHLLLFMRYFPIVTSVVIPHNKFSGCLSKAIVTLKTTSPPTVLEIGEMLVTFPLMV